MLVGIVDDGIGEIARAQALCTFEIYQALDLGRIGAAARDRAGFDALIQASMQHRLNVLLLDDLTRLGRDMAETPRIVKQLKFAGIRVIGVSDGVDTDRDGYKAEIGLRGIMGEMYLDDLAEKTHRGLTGQALTGKSAAASPTVIAPWPSRTASRARSTRNRPAGSCKSMSATPPVTATARSPPN